MNYEETHKKVQLLAQLRMFAQAMRKEAGNVKQSEISFWDKANNNILKLIKKEFESINREADGEERGD